MLTMREIESKCAGYATAREALAGVVMALEEERTALKHKYIARIRRLVEAAKERRGEIKAALDESAALFVKPRTVIYHGVKVGYVKAKGKIEWDDEAKVIARMRELLPEEQVELLVRVSESVHKPGVYDLTAGDLKRLGIRIVGDGDEVVLKDTAGEIDKLVDALLKDGPEEVAE